MAVLIPTRNLDFHESLRDAGIPVEGVSGAGPECVIHLAAGATPEQQQQARQMAQAFDWTEPTEKQLRKRQAMTAIASESPSDIAHRAAIRVLQKRLIRALQALNETREALRQTRTELRQLAQQLASGGLPITVPGPLPLPNIEVLNETQAIAEWQQQIEAETLTSVKSVPQ